MLSIDTIARVAVNAVRSAAQPTSFDTGLLLVKDTNYAAAKRLKSYASSAEAAAGLVADVGGSVLPREFVVAPVEPRLGAPERRQQRLPERPVGDDLAQPLVVREIRGER